MPSPNINASDTIEVGRQKINAHFNDAAEHSRGGGRSGITPVDTVAALKVLTGVPNGERRYPPAAA
jgi:hypothetical protein